MSEAKCFSFFVAFFSFIHFNLPGAVSSTVGMRLGELCDYRRVCLDVNAKCKGQVISGGFVKQSENTFKYRCECKRYYKEEDGKCQISDNCITAFPVYLICISIGLVVIILVIPWWKTDQPQPYLLGESV